MKKKIVTISRQYGSGGRYIGENLAKAMGVPCYDEKLIDMVAKESGFAQSFVAEKGERMTGSLLFNIASSLSFANNVFSTNNGVTLQDEIYFTQNRIIKELADKGPCVIVGRCADEILAYNPNLVSVFITGDRESKIARVMDREGLDRKQAINKMKRMDKIRKTYHNFYCRNKWGDSRGYDICINTGKTDFDTAKNMVVECVDKLKERSE